MCNCHHDCGAYKRNIEIGGTPDSCFIAASTGFSPNITATLTINSGTLGTVLTN
jgi:hypothetical protein